MTAADQSAALDTAAFNALFDAARHSVFRLEGHQFYAGDTSYEAWRNHRGRPERSLRTSAWLRRIAAQTTRAEPVDWSRVRVVTEDLSDYTQYELMSYVESQAVGERVGIVRRESCHADLDALPDFWLIDGGTETAVAVRMNYGSDGVLVSRVLVTDHADLDRLAGAAAFLLRVAAPLNQWLPDQGVTLVG